MAYRFNGSSQYLTAAMSAPSLPFTMSVRFSVSSLPPSTPPSAIAYTLFAFDSGANNDYRSYRLQLINTGALRALVVNSDGSAVAVAATAASSVATNTVYTGTAVFVSTTSRSVFLDNTKVTNTSSLSITTPTRLIIGATQGGDPDISQLTNGDISEGAVWSVALTDSEIGSLAAGFTPSQVCPQSLQFYAPLVRNLSDVRGGRVITNTGTATVANHPRIIT